MKMGSVKDLTIIEPAYENKLGIGLVNQVIPKGGSLQVESSALDSLYFTVSGRVLS